MAYETTNVAVEKSQGELRVLLQKFGASEFQFGEGNEGGDRWAGVTFTHNDQMVMVQVKLKEPDAATRQKLWEKAERAYTKTLDDIMGEWWGQEERRIWRVLFWSLKARMVAVEENVETFEQAFLAHLVNPATGQTLWQHLAPAIEEGAFRLGGSGLAALERGTND